MRWNIASKSLNFTLPHKPYSDGTIDQCNECSASAGCTQSVPFEHYANGFQAASWSWTYAISNDDIMARFWSSSSCQVNTGSNINNQTSTGSKQITFSQGTSYRARGSCTRVDITSNPINFGGKTLNSYEVKIHMHVQRTS